MFAVGEPVTAMDRTGEWLDGRVVAARGEGDALELKIHFSGWSKVHDEWLRAAGGKVQSRDTPVEDLPEPTDGYLFNANEFVVDALLGKRKRNGETQYLVRFESGEGMEPEEPSWQWASDVGEAAIEEYEAGPPVLPFVQQQVDPFSPEVSAKIAEEWLADVGMKAAAMLERQTTEEFASRKLHAFSPCPAWLFKALHASLRGIAAEFAGSGARTHR